jgi:hypothetical protein
MISFICKILQSFRFIFSRTTTWIMFCAVVLGFIGATDMIGISSFCRFYSVDESAYNAFIHFFRYSSWSLTAISLHWEAFVLSQTNLYLMMDVLLCLVTILMFPKMVDECLVL